MKKLISLFVIASLLLSSLVFTSNAATKAEIMSDDFNFSSSGSYSIKDIKNSLDEYKDGSITAEKLAEKYGTQLKSLDVFIENFKDVNDIYGLQFNVKLSGDNVALAYLTTGVQNGNKVGVSKWEAHLSVRDNDYRSALILMYGTKPVTSDANKSVNLVNDNKIKVATIYYLVGNEQKSDFTVTYKVEDIASKDSKNTVLSAKADFKETTTTTAKHVENEDDVKLDMLGAQIRVSGEQGLRFGTKVVKNNYYKELKDITFGTLIAVTNQIDGKPLTLESDMMFLDSTAKVLEETDEHIVFSGEVQGFKLNGEYNSVNFTARSYIKFKAPNSSKHTIIYADPIVRSVAEIKSIIGMK